MPVLLPFVPALLEFIGFPIIIGEAFMMFSYAPGAASAFAGGAVIVLIAIVVYIYVLYKWVSRRNSHFEPGRS